MPEDREELGESAISRNIPQEGGVAGGENRNKLAGFRG